MLIWLCRYIHWRIDRIMNNLMTKQYWSQCVITHTIYFQFSLFKNTTINYHIHSRTDALNILRIQWSKIWKILIYCIIRFRITFAYFLCIATSLYMIDNLNRKIPTFYHKHLPQSFRKWKTRHNLMQISKLSRF